MEKDILCLLLTEKHRSYLILEADQPIVVMVVGISHYSETSFVIFLGCEKALQVPASTYSGRSSLKNVSE